MSNGSPTWGPNPAVPPSPVRGCLPAGCLPVMLILLGSAFFTMVGRAAVDAVFPGGSRGDVWGAFQVIVAVAVGVGSFHRYRRGSSLPWWSYVLTMLILPVVAIGMLCGYIAYRGRSWSSRLSKPLFQSPLSHWGHSTDPVQRVREQAWSAARGGAFLGFDEQGGWLGVNPEDALLV